MVATLADPYPTVEAQKAAAALAAVGLVRSGMVVGLGAGSTAAIAVRRLAEQMRDGSLRDIVGIACSLEVERQAREAGIVVGDLDEHGPPDITIDGADEVDADLNLIKGRGGAMAREKIVAQVTCREVIVVDGSKTSPMLGSLAPVPVEVLPFGRTTQIGFLRELGATPYWRTRPDGTPFLTDQGNPVLDCHFGPIADPAALADALGRRGGIVAHGLFVGLATDVFVGTAQGVRHLNLRGCGGRRTRR
ncbi:MAG: ribose-5-phosphate isomerase RpiA [Anaerolineae bacterium]